MRISKIVSTLLWMSTVALSSSVWANPPPQNFQIDVQPLVTALKAFSARTGLHIVYVTEIADGVVGSPVNGKLEADEALNRILENTGLEYKYIDSRTIGIRRKAGAKDSVANEPVKPVEYRRINQTDLPAQDSGPAPAAGQESAPESSSPPVTPSGRAAPHMVEEVVVNVRRWKENPQDVPESMSVLSGAQIEAAGVQSFADFASLTPNLSVHEYFRPGVMGITMRGIPTAQGGEPPVAVIVDGVQAAGLDFLNQQLFDLESIQILRGPQGALYGRGAIGGAIIVNTRQPTNEFEGQAKLSYGNGNDLRSVASFSGPILKDRLFFRISGATINRDGLIYDRTRGEEDDYVDEYSARGELKFLVTDQLTLDLRANHVDGKAGMTVVENVNDANYLDFSIFPNRDMDKYNERTIDEASLKLDYELSFGTLTAVSAFSDSRTDGFGDADFGPLDLAQGTNAVNVKAWSHDLRLASKGDGRLRWVVGAFMQDRETVNDLLIEATPTSPILAPGTILAQSDQFDTSDAWAVYAQTAYKLTDKLDLTTAVRYDVDDRESEDDLVPGSFISKSFELVQPKVSLAYHVTPDVMLYASYGKGFRSGGFNALRDSQQNPAVSRQYPQEKSENIEMGVKSDLVEGLMTLNASLFHILFDNQQFYFIDIANTARSIVTFNETSISGLEVEAALTPMTGLELNASVGITDAEITDFNGTGMFDRNNSPSSYAHTVNLSTQYVRPMGTSGWEILGRVDYEHRGRIYWAPDNRHVFPPTDFVNLRAGVQSERWSFVAFCRNLTDEKTATIFTPYSSGGGTGHGRFRNQPRHYGVEISARF